MATAAATAVNVPLWRAAHGRTGDKGSRANISVIAWAPELYPLLVQQLSEDAVARQTLLQNEGFEEPGRVSQMPFGRTCVLHGLDDRILGAQWVGKLRR